MPRNVFSINLKGINEAIGIYRGGLKTIMDAAELSIRDVLFNEMLTTAKENATFRVLHRHRGSGTGRLAQAIFAQVKRQGNLKVTGSLNVDLKQVPYARVHEFGGIIRPKNVNWLTIPFPGKNVTKSAREYPRTFFQRSRKGNLILFQNEGAGRIKPLFILKKMVRIPKRAYLRPAIEQHFPLLQRRLREELEALNL